MPSYVNWDSGTPGERGDDTVRYPATFDWDELAECFVIQFPDIDHGVVQARTEQEGMRVAADLLAAMIAEVIRRSEELPPPSRRHGRNMRLVDLPTMAGAKAELYRAMRAAGLRKSGLARRLGVSEQRVDELLNLRRQSRLDRLEAAFHALGKRLTMEVRDAA